MQIQTQGEYLFYKLGAVFYSSNKMFVICDLQIRKRRIRIYFNTYITNDAICVDCVQMFMQVMGRISTIFCFLCQLPKFLPYKINEPISLEIIMLHIHTYTHKIQTQRNILTQTPLPLYPY